MVLVIIMFEQTIYKKNILLKQTLSANVIYY